MDTVAANTLPAGDYRFEVTVLDAGSGKPLASTTTPLLVE